MIGYRQHCGNIPEQDALAMIKEGRQTLSHDTFGDEEFWGDASQLHRAIAGEQLGGAICRSTVDDSFARGIGKRLDGWRQQPHLHRLGFGHALERLCRQHADARKRNVLRSAACQRTRLPSRGQNQRLEYPQRSRPRGPVVYGSYYAAAPATYYNACTAVPRTTYYAPRIYAAQINGPETPQTRQTYSQMYSQPAYGASQGRIPTLPPQRPTTTATVGAFDNYFEPKTITV
jgi:hypothetical protein